MKWMIASDIHGSEYYCNELLETIMNVVNLERIFTG